MSVLQIYEKLTTVIDSNLHFNEEYWPRPQALLFSGTTAACVLESKVKLGAKVGITGAKMDENQTKVERYC